MMKKISIAALLVAMAVAMAAPAQAAFTVGGENGWALSTDGIVNIFGTYMSTEANPAAGSPGGGFTLLNAGGNATQEFGVKVGLLPSIVALNVKAPTTAGIDSSVRVAMYPSVQNSSDNRFDVAPNIDFREFFYTASGKFGSFLAGRALNLFQGQNILNDMTLFTAGVVTDPRTSTSLGHIGYGYLYTNFGPQFRYTTPDMGGVKVALAIAEPYAISSASAKQNIPRIETEVSYANTLKNGSIHAWLGAMWQQDTRTNGKHNTSLGIAPGVNVGIGPVGIMMSGYYGRGLGIVSAQDGSAFGDGPVDSNGKERKSWGFLAQTTFQATDSLRLGVNYGRNDFAADGALAPVGIKKTQEAAVVTANYNLNKFTQFTLEGIWARDSWYGVNDKMESWQAALGTVFFW